MSDLLWFFAGLFLGGTGGVVCMALMLAAREAERNV